MGERQGVWGLFLSSLSHSPPLKANLGPLLPSSEERNHRGFWFCFVCLFYFGFAPPPTFKIKQNRFLPCHSPLLCGLGMEVELGDNQFIAETWLGQLPSVRPLAPRELHSSELQGTGNGHSVSPNFHTFGQEQKAFGENGSIPIWVPSPPGHLSSWKKFLNSQRQKQYQEKNCHKYTHMCTHITPHTSKPFSHILVHTTHPVVTSSPTCPTLGSL